MYLGMAEYKIDRKIVDCAEFLSKYMDVEKFLPLCRSCSNYGKLHTCPPFEENLYSLLKDFKYLELFAMTVPSGDIAEYKAARRYFDEQMLMLEEKNSGAIAFFAGSCLICEDGNCARNKGMECHHKDLSRLSLEALGIDVTAALSDIFGVRLEWATEGHSPESMTLLSALALDKFVV